MINCKLTIYHQSVYASAQRQPEPNHYRRLYSLQWAGSVTNGPLWCLYRALTGGVWLVCIAWHLDSTDAETRCSRSLMHKMGLNGESFPKSDTHLIVTCRTFEKKSNILPLQHHNKIIWNCRKCWSFPAHTACKSLVGSWDFSVIWLLRKWKPVFFLFTFGLWGHVYTDWWAGLRNESLHWEWEG